MGNKSDKIDTMPSAQVTDLTNNSNCSATSKGDVNNTTTVTLMSPKNVTVPSWTLSVSTASPSQALAADVGTAFVTFEKGLTVTYQPQGSAYAVLLTGKIKDNGVVQNFTNLIVYQYLGS